MVREIKVPELVTRKEGDVNIVERTDEQKNGRLLYWCECVACGRRFKAVPKEVRGGRWICPCQQGLRPRTVVPKGNPLSVSDLAYLGGLIDGEGYVGILKPKRSHREGRPGFQAYATIGHTSLELLNKVQQMVGLGKIHDRKATNVRHKRSYQLDWKPNHLRELLPQLLPHLRLKRRQAELVLEYLGFAGQVNHKNSDAVAAYNAKCEDLHARTKELNRRGASETPERSVEREPQFTEETKLAYLAGLIDGEGTLALRKSKRVHRDGRVMYGACATIPNTNLSLLQLADDCVGGGNRIRARKRRSEKHRQCHELWWGPSVLRQLLPALRPHLREKQRQAYLLLDHLAVAGKFDRRDPGAVTAYMEGRELVYLELKRLNQRGVPQEPAQ
ncbi:MAG: hypothetical protein U0840_09445 [Gemmataceae bacterium]